MYDFSTRLNFMLEAFDFFWETFRETERERFYNKDYVHQIKKLIDKIHNFTTKFPIL